jgi:formylglycine-generating enzyme required for sulfatase activity
MLHHLRNKSLYPGLPGIGLLLALYLLFPVLGPAAQEEAAPLPEGCVAIRAAGDAFTMGDGDNGPGVQQSLGHDYCVARLPVTNADYGPFITEGGYEDRSLWTDNGWSWKGKVRQPAFWKDRSFNAPDQPVVGVSWYEAVAFCNWLSRKEGLAAAYDSTGRLLPDASGYRLPTEVEWEYAAAKGAPGEARRLFAWGDDWDPKKTVCRAAPPRATRPAAVGSRSPEGDTPQGIADMSGNVWQWCSDNAQSDRKVASSPGEDRYCFESDAPSVRMVLRGGSWYNDFARGFRVSFRNYTSIPGARFNVNGFRVVRTLPPAAEEP